MKPSRRWSLPRASRLVGARVCVAAAVMAIILAAVAACGSSATTTAGRPMTEAATRLACSPRVLASLPFERWSAARHRLAPPGASAIRLCRYSGLNVHPRLTLVSSRLIEGSGLVRELVSEFDRLPAPPAGATACPGDDGSQIAALLSYRGGHVVTITVGLTGCDEVSNGSVQRTAEGFGSPPPFGPQLIAQLEGLVSAHAPSESGSAAVLSRSRWSVLTRSPLGTRYGSTFLWDGRELLELGGTAGGRLGGAPSDSGAAYDPQDHRWRHVADAPAAVLPINVYAVLIDSLVAESP